MPEGHTIHRIASDHTQNLVGQQLTIESPQGRFADGAKLITGCELTSIDAFGKHLLYRFGDQTLHIHLGLYGKFRKHSLPVPEPRGMVRLRMIGDQCAFDLNGPTACELMSVSQVQKLVNRIGPDPLRADCDKTIVFAKIQKSGRAIGKLLMDQSVISGVGNVYRAEVLHLLNIHPDTPGHSFQTDQLDDMWKLIVRLLKIGKKYNRIIVADPQDIGKPRSQMNNDERLLVYKKSHCGQCETPIEIWKMDGRKVYACPVCQPAESN